MKNVNPIIDPPLVEALLLFVSQADIDLGPKDEEYILKQNAHIKKKIVPTIQHKNKL